MDESVSNSTFSFFYKNLTVAGFYEENALFMTVKELFDNSIDALSNLKIDEKKIEVVVQEYSKDLSFYKIVCRDNGEGIEIKDLKTFGEMFLTSKDKCKTTGKFGIGLKTILLYSFKTAYGCLHIKIKIENNKIWDFFLVMDKSLNYTHVENFQEYTDDEWNWTVEISVILKINDKYIFDKRILFYIKLTLLWKSDINVNYICDLNQFEYCCPKLTIANATNSTGTSTGTGTQSINTTKKIQTKKRTRGVSDHNSIKGGYRSATSKSNSENIFNLLIDQGVSLLVEIERLTSFNFNLHAIINVRKSNKSTCDTLNMPLGVICLIRYANSMPLIGPNTECSLRKDFKKFIKIHGPQFGIELLSLTETINEDLIEKINFDSLKDLKKICDTFHVKKSEKSTWDVIIVGLNVIGSDISFTNLNKNCIQEGDYLSNLVQKCMLNVFNHTKKQLPHEFESVADFQLRQALNIYGTQLAASLSKIILKGRDEFQNKVFYLLNENKKKQDTEKSGNDKTNNLNTSIEIGNEQELTDILYKHIKEKIMTLNNDKVHGNMNKKNESSDTSSACEYGNYKDDGVYYFDGEAEENDEWE